MYACSKCHKQFEGIVYCDDGFLGFNHGMGVCRECYNQTHNFCPNCKDRALDKRWNYCPICGTSIPKNCDMCGTFFQGLDEGNLCMSCEEQLLIERAKDESRDIESEE